MRLRTGACQLFISLLPLASCGDNLNAENDGSPAIDAPAVPDAAVSDAAVDAGPVVDAMPVPDASAD